MPSVVGREAQSLALPEGEFGLAIQVFFCPYVIIFLLQICCVESHVYSHFVAG